MFPYQELLARLQLDLRETIPHHLEHDVPITSDMSVAQVRAVSLNRSFYKKLNPSGQLPDADAKALEKFKVLNASISSDPFEYPVTTEQDSLFWDYFRDNFLKALSPTDALFDLDFIRDGLAAGPGASLNCDNKNFFTKMFASRISVTSQYLLTLYRGAIFGSELWSKAEKLRNERYGVEIVRGNRLFFVPKTAVISRTCCTEPLVNMLIQQAIGAYLQVCLLRSFGVSLSTQPDNNRELARIGSLDGSFGTIDLQSASDSISWSLVQRICPGSLLGYLRHARCEETELPDGSKVTLNMISTMGNGFTFPLQTIIFACAVRSVYQLMGLDSSCPRSQFGVFGDDIIVRKDAYVFLCKCLSNLGFKVNDDKSFNTGAFRESCGHDYYDGHFVRGVYIKSLETMTDVYSAINRLNRWTALSGVRLTNTINFLLGFTKRKLLIPFCEAVDGGIQVPFKLTVPRVGDNYWFAYKKLTSKSLSSVVPDDSEGSNALDYPFYNDWGWGVSFLGGYARRDDNPLIEPRWDQDPSERVSPLARIGHRDIKRERRIKVAHMSIPYWDWLGPEELNRQDYSFEYEDLRVKLFSFSDWEIAVAANFGEGRS